MSESISASDEPPQRRRRPARPQSSGSGKGKNVTTPPPDYPPEEDNRWWVIVSEAEDATRYGVWESKPKSNCQDNIVHIWGGVTEPELWIGMKNAVTVSIGQTKHFDARPIEAPDEESQ